MRLPLLGNAASPAVHEITEADLAPINLMYYLPSINHELLLVVLVLVLITKADLAQINLMYYLPLPRTTTPCTSSSINNRSRPRPNQPDVLFAFNQVRTLLVVLVLVLITEADLAPINLMYYLPSINYELY